MYIYIWSKRQNQKKEAQRCLRPSLTHSLKILLSRIYQRRGITIIRLTAFCSIFINGSGSRYYFFINFFIMMHSSCW